MLPTKPMKAPSKQITDEQLDNLIYPVLASAKLDGYCCLCNNGAYTSTLKPIKNNFIRRILSNPIYNGLHGEIVVGPPNHPDAFNNTTGPVRRADGKPNFKLHVFDYFANVNLPYEDRYIALLMKVNSGLLPFVELVPQTLLPNKAAVREFEQECIDADYEGAMIRSLSAPYKQGRCTAREAYIFKLKPTEDAEGEIIGFYEKLKNGNIATINELGLSRRASNRENKEGAGTLGGMLIRTTTKGLPWTDIKMRCGIGRMTHDMAQYIWDHRPQFLGALGTYKYQAVGSIDLPRQPIWKGFRDRDDITNF